MHTRYTFSGGSTGSWRVRSGAAVKGDGLAPVSHVDVAPADSIASGIPTGWRLDGLISNIRYATRGEVTSLRAIQAPLGRDIARRAALIPIRKSKAWWDLAQDERRAVFETQSRHTAIGLEYLPAVARQLYHCRDIGQPFDFLTWFEYAPSDEAAFDDLLARLRSSIEWSYVEREVDIRLER